jgi:prepilin-type N-terminal cleavage/methylation domain-containing protein
VPREKNRRSGFTLVELIVVIVILGILAAIAIPALTGYISKAEDEQYKMRARDISIAMRTVIDEAWAKGDFAGDGVDAGFGSEVPAYYFEGNDTAIDDDLNLIAFWIGRLSAAAYGDWDVLNHRSLGLLGEHVVPDQVVFEYHGVAAKDSGANAATADGFFIFLNNGSDDTRTLVTYRLTHVDGVRDDEEFREAIYRNDVGGYRPIAYDANAGYEIYRNIGWA